jgi:glutamate/tyrosine decarboxylase-like PLP-dependent enzyme
VPYDAGCLLVRDAVRQHETFSGRPSYLASIGGLAGGDPWPCDLGIELSRNFRALKIWFSIKEHGTERLGAAIARNCAQAFNLAMRLRGHPFLRVMAPVSLNIVCCRYHVPGIDEIALDSLNARIVVTLQESGIAAPSTCRINGRLCIRICITNHRSRDSDFDVLIGAIEELGASLLAQPS